MKYNLIAALIIAAIVATWTGCAMYTVGYANGSLDTVINVLGHKCGP